MKDILPDIDACEFPHCHSVDDTVFAVNTPDGRLVDVGDIVTREAHIKGFPARPMSICGKAGRPARSI